jgi:DNA-binding PadR family transcriptional regulator
VAQSDKSDILQGTLDLMVLKTLDAMGPMHGYGIATDVRERTGGELSIEDAALCQSLHRLDRQGLVDAEWGTSEKQPPRSLLHADGGRTEAAADLRRRPGRR